MIKSKKKEIIRNDSKEIIRGKQDINKWNIMFNYKQNRTNETTVQSILHNVVRNYKKLKLMINLWVTSRSGNVLVLQYILNAHIKRKNEALKTVTEEIETKLLKCIGRIRRMWNHTDSQENCVNCLRLNPEKRKTQKTIDDENNHWWRRNKHLQKNIKL